MDPNSNRYNKALERARKIYNQTEFDYEKGLIEDIFPELQKNEKDDKKKELIEFLKDVSSGSLDPTTVPCKTIWKWIVWIEKQYEQKLTLPKWKYKKDHTPLLRDSLILNKYGCVVKSPSGAIVSDVWVIDYDELANLPKEEFEKQGEQKETLCDKCRKEQHSHSCQDITELGRCALEYQGKQKPADEIELKFKVGD